MSDREQTRRAPLRVASHVLSLTSEDFLATVQDRVELNLAVSEKEGVSADAFTFARVPVALVNGQGRFFAYPGHQDSLEWVMVGEPGGHMKVVVSRNGAAIATRPASTIAPPYGEAYDALEIRV